MPNDHQAQGNWKSRRRHTENITKKAVAKNPPAIRLSETAFSQIHPGSHSRHAPCGLKVDIIRLSPKAVGTGSIQSVRRDQVQIIQVSANRASAAPSGARLGGNNEAVGASWPP